MRRRNGCTLPRLLTMRTMNTHRPLVLAALFSMMALGAMGCTIATHPAQISVGPAVQTQVVYQTAPTRVYHNGSWLHYRTDGYYYRSGSTWHVANTVPTHVYSYHRPGRPVHVTSHSARPSRVVHTTRPTHVRPTHARPTHVVHSPRPTHVQTTTRPAPRPTHVRSSSRPAARPTGQVRSTRGSRPTHVGRTVGNRRTYRR
jgi:hypothetical protein